ncbi:RNA-binding domain-containing protein [Bacteroides sp. UBA939]|uniref:RNA-binding domain-containing protein n=1 Tax=Bacteroides sp. UBA939 TaxID=1946092 RepID=UPI0025B840D0|nr:RNA-binding domain-containing protein [Bacteroides sp. UBA939]
MTSEEILKLRDTAEQTRVQFKERITRDNKYDVSCEMVTFSNTHGGIIIIGIDDKTGRINPLSFKEVQETTNMLGGLASDGVVPSILIDIENVPMEGGVIVVVTIKQGLNKPYRDNKGIIWMKQGTDKRKVFDNAELIAMLMENGQVHPDSMPVKGTSMNDLDEDIMKEYLIKRFHNEFERQEQSITDLRHKSLSEITSIIGQTLNTILKNFGLVQTDGTLTLAALALMGKYPQRWLPAFTVRCISFVGNNIGGTEFRDKSGGDADGNAVHLYKYIMSFLTRNLRHIQVEKEFNSQGELEVSATTLSEIVVNSILHRSYIIEAPLRIFIFDNRIEIHSPGLLPEGVNMESIKHGISVPRNKLFFNHAIHLLPYTGAGSGITRAMKFTPSIIFKNDEMLNEFVVTISREENVANDRVVDRDDRDKELIEKKIEEIRKTPDDRVEDDRDKCIPYKNLDGTQKHIIQFCSIPRTAREILEHIGYSYHPIHIAKYIKPLIKIGFIEMTEPEKPNSKNQKYRKVRKG